MRIKEVMFVSAHDDEGVSELVPRLFLRYFPSKKKKKRGGGPTGGEAGLLFPLSEVRVRVKVRLQRRRVDGFAPAFPLDQVGHPALGHGRGLGHMVLDDLGNPCRRKAHGCALTPPARFSSNARTGGTHRAGRIAPARRSLGW